MPGPQSDKITRSQQLRYRIEIKQPKIKRLLVSARKIARLVDLYNESTATNRRYTTRT